MRQRSALQSETRASAGAHSCVDPRPRGAVRVQCCQATRDLVGELTLATPRVAAVRVAFADLAVPADKTSRGDHAASVLCADSAPSASSKLLNPGLEPKRLGRVRRAR